MGRLENNIISLAETSKEQFASMSEEQRHDYEDLWYAYGNEASGCFGAYYREECLPEFLQELHKSVLEFMKTQPFHGTIGEEYITLIDAELDRRKREAEKRKSRNNLTIVRDEKDPFGNLPF